LLIKYIKSVLWRVAKCVSYIEEARCLKVKSKWQLAPLLTKQVLYSGSSQIQNLKFRAVTNFIFAFICNYFQIWKDAD